MHRYDNVISLYNPLSKSKYIWNIFGDVWEQVPNRKWRRPPGPVSGLTNSEMILPVRQETSRGVLSAMERHDGPRRLRDYDDDDIIIIILIPQVV